jgi:hypothetical protein
MPCELTKHHNHYLELLHKDEIPDHKKYEYLYALELIYKIIKLDDYINCITNDTFECM